METETRGSRRDIVTPRARTLVIEAVVVAALFGAAMLASQSAMRVFRADGSRPLFYQSNFEPAVMMACGRGFVTSSLRPQQLDDFLNVTRDDFDCELLPAALTERAVTMPANANWYYLYGAAAFVWTVTGVSWLALDVLVSGMSAVVCVVLYGLFRLIAGLPLAAALALLLTLSPANLTHLLSLRDYSKAPFVLAAVLILGTLVMRPTHRAATWALAVAYGVVVGVGYGFRGDLAVMVPFGVVVVLFLLPGSLRANAFRNTLAAAVLLTAFLVSAWPVIGGLKHGGCQYHFALLGLTDPLTQTLRLTPSVYRLGEHLSDTFADLKTGDYAARVLGAPVPPLCTPDYDTASGALYFEMAKTFPADFVVRAYASVLMILRVGLAIPSMPVAAEGFSLQSVFVGFVDLVNAVTTPLSALGVITTLIAVACAWASSARLGLALTVFILFLAGYPAIRFDERHWFHLRFIPWWTALLVGTYLLRIGTDAWERPRLKRAATATVALLAALAVPLGALRVVQSGHVKALVESYLAAPTEPLPVRPVDAARLLVEWEPDDYGTPPARRASDLIVVTLAQGGCPGTGPVRLTVAYDAGVPSHDMSTTFTVPRPEAGGGPSRLFVPVFWQGYGDRDDLRFSGIHMSGASVGCIEQVARVTPGAGPPLWVELLVPTDWRDYSLYESMRLPSAFSR